VQLLLHSFPEYGRKAAQEKCRIMGRIPLFYAIRYEAPNGVVELLLDYLRTVDDILEKDKVGISILGLVWDSWANREGKQMVSPFIQQFDKMLQPVPLETLSWDAFTKSKLPDPFRLQLEKVEMILQGAFRHRPGKSKWRLLHACSAIHCHPSLFMTACVLHSEQAREIDQDDLFQQPSTDDDHQRPNRQTALHFAAKVHSHGIESRKILMGLITLYPEAAAFKNPRDDCYPFHYLCYNESKVHWIHDGLRDVYEAYTDVVYQGNCTKQLPLHLAASVARYRPSPVLASNQSWTQDTQDPLQHPNIDASGSIVQNLIDAYPESSRKMDDLGMLPFHHISQTSEFWTVDVEVLYMSYPDVIHINALCDYNLPLHFAASNVDAKHDFVHALVELYPSGCSVLNNEGKLPLHIACEKGKRWDEVKTIYAANMAAVFSTVRETGRLPIHYAAACKTCPKELLTELIKRNIESVTVKDSMGKMPLHWAIQSGKFWDDGLDILIEAGPDSMDVADNNGMVPFILATFVLNKNCSSDVIRSLETLFQLLQRAPHVLNHYRIK
jgi:ankyrin repeat protein